MKITLLRGDITTIKADALVNAANEGLWGGGGVDGAIHRAGGPVIAEDCSRIRKAQGGCPTGQAVYTRAGSLPARFVIHTVGPIWQDGQQGEKSLLYNCYLSSLRIAEELGLESLAFPNISTGVYGFPKELAARTAVKAVRECNSNRIREIIFVCYDEENFNIYKELLAAD